MIIVKLNIMKVLILLILINNLSWSCGSKLEHWINPSIDGSILPEALQSAKRNPKIFFAVSISPFIKNFALKWVLKCHSKSHYTLVIHVFLTYQNYPMFLTFHSLLFMTFLISGFLYLLFWVLKLKLGLWTFLLAFLKVKTAFQTKKWLETLQNIEKTKLEEKNHF